MIAVLIIRVLPACHVDEIQYDAEINIVFAVQRNNVGVS